MNIIMTSLFSVTGMMGELWKTMPCWDELIANDLHLYIYGDHIDAIIQSHL